MMRLALILVAMPPRTLRSLPSAMTTSDSDSLVLLYSWWLRRMQARKLDRSRKEGRKWTLMKTLGAKLGATSDQMASISKYNSFSANVTQINVVVENLSMFLLHSALRRDPPKKILDRVNLTFPVGSLN